MKAVLEDMGEGDGLNIHFRTIFQLNQCGAASGNEFNVVCESMRFGNEINVDYNECQWKKTFFFSL